MSSLKHKAVFNWSGGKDSALALYKALQSEQFEIVALLTTINKIDQTSSIHNIPLHLLEKQADSIGIPLFPIELQKDTKTYEKAMEETVVHFKKKGVTHFIFGDIHLKDVKAYREKQLNPLGIEVVEPLWSDSSQAVMSSFLSSEIQTKIIVTQADKLGEEFIGKNLDKALLASLPIGIDPAGENGEYHTFAYQGGPFRYPIDFSISEVKKISHDFKMSDGNCKTFHYWQAVL